MTLRWSLETSSYSSSCLRMSKLRASTLRCALSMLRGDDAGLDRLAVGHLEAVHDGLDAIAGEDAHQRVFEREVEARGARVALAARAAAQLVVDAARLVPLGGDDAQAAELHDLLVQALPLGAQLCRRAAASRRPAGSDPASISCTCFSTLPPSTMSVPRPAMLVAIVIIFGRPACAMISASLACCLALSTWCGSLACLEQAGDQLGVLDRGGAHQHRLAALVALADVLRAPRRSARALVL